MKAAQPEVAAAHRVNPGESLRVARESKGLSVAEVAAQLNLTPMRLSQLEAGEFEKLPGHTFARGYIRAYAKLLGLEQSTLVSEFDQFTGSDAAGSSVHALGRIEEPVRYSQGILRLVSFLLLLALGGACFYWWQEQGGWQLDDFSSSGIGHVEVDGADGTTQIHPLDEPEDQAVAEAQNGTELPLPSLPVDEAAQAEGAEPEATAGELLEQNPPAAGAAAPANPAQAPAATETPAAPAASAPAAPAATPPAAPAVAGEGLVSIRFTADCWIQITDATGKIVSSGLKRSGDSLDVRARAPLELRLGFARGAQVSYNGNAVDVTPFISGETARLQLGGQ
ncbi:RodZ domain-containing protein [Phytopseudomonas dryadis]|uniref:DUF4115 domain-containing protein n=1 Tax=Phytopseudomonas dryadis TaxID=2487520 RepID=A0A4Q9R538_9GAMM|nr:RodZ domain-containing protein [Pseudomonas dryadis]TBU94438.1 DUF4115 domain-containing protein [Pseudomonas dryadis]